jgi:hypothetical protein
MRVPLPPATRIASLGTWGLGVFGTWLVVRGWGVVGFMAAKFKKKNVGGSVRTSDVQNFKYKTAEEGS